MHLLTLLYKKNIDFRDFHYNSIIFYTHSLKWEMQSFSLLRQQKKKEKHTHQFAINLN